MKKEKENSETTLTSPPTGGTIQVGSIVAYYGTTAPDTWLLCDGSKIPNTYGTLIALIGDYTPNFSARVLVGTGTGTDENKNTKTVELGDSGGTYKVTLALTEIPSHQHFGWGERDSPNAWGTGNSSSTGFKGSGDSDTDNYLYGSTFSGGTPGGQIATTNGAVTGTSAGPTTAHDNVQPYFAINYIIYAGTN